MRCPVCGKDATTPQGLRKHMMGTFQAGGHERASEEADVLLRRAMSAAAGVAPAAARRSAPLATRAPGREAPVTSPSVDAAGAFLTEIFDALVANKLLPKYQFERRVDIFVSAFLPELLSTLLGGQYRLVAPEFPLKKVDNHQTTNVDHLFFRTTPEGRETWVLFELKTDEGSIDMEQLASYRRAAERGMPSLMQDLALVRDNSSAGAKYDELLARFVPFPADRPIELVYLAPVRVDADRLGDGGRSLTFGDLRGVELTRHPEIWRTFRDSVLARAF